MLIYKVVTFSHFKHLHFLTGIRWYNKSSIQLYEENLSLKQFNWNLFNFQYKQQSKLTWMRISHHLLSSVISGATWNSKLKLHIGNVHHEL